jgi:hypothetical protein
VIQPRALNLSDVVNGVEQLLLRTLGEHVELITDLAGRLSPVLAGPGQIEQVLVTWPSTRATRCRRAAS